MDYQPRLRTVDGISGLPDEILGQILSYLPTKEAVKTCILSKRWKDSFKLAYDFNFELDDKIRQHDEKSTRAIIKSFMNCVNRALFWHDRTNIGTFCLKCGEGIDPSSVYGWICAVISCGVQHLDLVISTSELFTLPSALFICRTLVTLKLKSEIILYVPNNVCLPMLKTLHLKSIEFRKDESVERFFSSCISLEEVVVEKCKLISLKVVHPLLRRLTIISDYSWNDYIWNHYLESLMIDAPNLVYFKFDDFADNYSLLNLPFLVNADINFPMLSFEDYTETAGTVFFKGISNVQSLGLSLPALQVLLFYDLYHHLFNLVQLKIHFGNREDIEYMFLARLNSLLLKHPPPNLEKLVFYEEIFYLSDLPREVPTCLDLNLKVIEIIDSDADRNSVEKAKYFLKNTTYLENLKISTRQSVAKEQKLKMAEELMASPRKSNQCCILIV